MLQPPSDSSFPFIPLKGSGYAWPSMGACDEKSEWPQLTCDTRDVEEESQGHLLVGQAGGLSSLLSISPQDSPPQPTPCPLPAPVRLTLLATTQLPPAHGMACLPSFLLLRWAGGVAGQPQLWPWRGYLPTKSPAGSGCRVTPCPPRGQLQTQAGVM